MSAIATMLPTAQAVMPAWVPSPLYGMTVDEYEAVVDSGAFRGRSRFHLINGFLVEKLTHTPPHAIAHTLSRDELGRVTPSGWHMRSALPVRLPTQASEPEPHHCVVRGVARDCLAAHPGPGDIAMLVEVADSSLAVDRELGARIYGPARLPVYWIVNLVNRQVEVYTQPGPTGYGSRRDYRSGESIPIAMGGHPVGEIAVADVLP